MMQTNYKQSTVQLTSQLVFFLDPMMQTNDKQSTVQLTSHLAFFFNPMIVVLFEQLFHMYRKIQRRFRGISFVKFTTPYSAVAVRHKVGSSQGYVVERTSKYVLILFYTEPFYNLVVQK